MSNLIGERQRPLFERLRGRLAPPFVLPIANETWTRGNREIAVFPLSQVDQRRVVRLLQMLEIQYRPQMAFCRRMNQLAQVLQVPLE